MKIKLWAVIVVLLMLTLTLGILGACGSQEQSLEGMVIVTFEFDGGVLDNGSTNVMNEIYHGYKPGSYIIDISNYKNYKFTKAGFVFEGWYTDPELTQRWDFNTRVNDDTTLYAKWEKAIVYSYGVYLVVDGKEPELLGSYRVQQGEKFSDSSRYGSNLRRQDRTFLGYYSDEALTTEWDEDFVHPGGEESNEVRVYVKSIEGVWQFVSDYSELVAALKTSDGIWLTDNVDCEGNSVNFGNSRGLFDRALQGNGFTISNITVGNMGTTRIPGYALFDTLGANAKIQNVNFENIQLTLKPYPDSTRIEFAGLALSVQSTTASSPIIDGVTVSGTYSVDWSDKKNLEMSDAEITQYLSKAIYGEYDSDKVTVTDFNSIFTLAQ